MSGGEGNVRIDAHGVDGSRPAVSRLTIEERSQLYLKAAQYGWCAADYPDLFWDCGVCPPFAPPVGIFAFELGEGRPAPPASPVVRSISRSAGWIQSEAGEIRWVEAVPNCGHVIIRKGEVCELPPNKAEATRLYRLFHAEWVDAWLRRGPTARAQSAAPAREATRTVPARGSDRLALMVAASADWLDQYTSPLGKRKHMRLCREGAFASARKEGKRWLVRRGEVDAYITQNAKPPPSSDSGDLDRELASLGMIEP